MKFKNTENRVDSYRHKGMRRRLVDSLRRKGIRDENVLQAMMAVPRHFFLDQAFEEWAYHDQPFPIGEEQTISQPFTVAYQTELLEIRLRDKVLEIGTGSGYQAAILAAMGARVFTVERHEPLYLNAQALLKQMGFENIRCFLRDGWKGLPEFAPFQKIIVTAGAEEIPEVLLRQLDIGGIMVIPVGKDGQTMHRIRRTGESSFDDAELEDFRFVPMLHGIEKKAGD